MRRRRKLAFALILVAIGILLLPRAGPLLVIDQPQRSDAILVLAGDENDQRFWKAIDLLRAGYATTAFIDARTDIKAFGRSPAQLESEFIQTAVPDLPVRVCPTAGDSTRDEVLVAQACFTSARTILIVTSDYHTRRALSIARNRLPMYSWSVAAAHSGLQSTPRWWTKRILIKSVFLEWQKLLWWECFERFR